jgi:hypothetical protein
LIAQLRAGSAELKAAYEAATRGSNVVEWASLGAERVDLVSEAMPGQGRYAADAPASESGRRLERFTEAVASAFGGSEAPGTQQQVAADAEAPASGGAAATPDAPVVPAAASLPDVSAWPRAVRFRDWNADVGAAARLGGVLVYSSRSNSVQCDGCRMPIASAYGAGQHAGSGSGDGGSGSASGAAASSGGSAGGAAPHREAPSRDPRPQD